MSLDETARLWVEAGGGLLPVSGRSMRPTFEEAARVWMEPANDARFGDLLVYSNGEFLIVHRVVAVHAGPLYRTKGDGLPHLDPRLVPAEQVLGRVVVIERGGARYRIDGAGGRAYARMTGALSALEGFLYRFAYRMDRLIGRVTGSSAGGGPALMRALLQGCGRLLFGALDRLLFRSFHRPLAL
jgi:hypothetical protein